MKAGLLPVVETINMETTEHGDTSSPVGLESADSSGEADAVEFLGHPLDHAATCIERAQDQLRYGRRQEAEGALILLKDAQACIRLARQGADGQG